MNKSKRSFKTIALLLCLISTGWGFGQKETTTFNETFVVNDATVLDINTSHADIEFETWSKDQIAVEAIIEIEGATREEAEEYFKNGGFEIVGNSKKVSITTGVENTWFFKHGVGGLPTDDFLIDLDGDVLAVDNIESIFNYSELPELPELAVFPELPELPEMMVPEFDYDAFTENSEEYLKKWQKQFQEGLGDDYPKKMKEWLKKLEIKQQEREERMEELQEKRAELHEKREEKLNERREKRAVARAKQRALIKSKTGNSIFISTDDNDDFPRRFYFSKGGENRNYKVKKTIKVKMPKGMKIKMNVRHGEVKLSDNIWHMDAQLSHAKLWAASIDGDKTTIILVPPQV